MDLRLTDDQQLFRETTRKFLESTSSLEMVRKLADTEPAGFDRKWWKRGAELGWVSMLVAEDDGGGSVSGHGLLDLVLVAEEMGRLVSPGPLLPTNVVAGAIARAGTPAQRQRLLPDLVNGDAVPPGASEPRRPESGPQVDGSRRCRRATDPTGRIHRTGGGRRPSRSLFGHHRRR